MSTPTILQYLSRSSIRFRIAIGLMGMAFPISLGIIEWLFGSGKLLDSVSSAYYSHNDLVRNLFVGGLVALAMLLIIYQYERVDTIASTIAGICMIGIAYFPAAPPVVVPTPTQHTVGIFHWVFSGVLLLTMAYFSLVLFRLPIGPFKPNALLSAIFLACGIVILGAGAVLGITGIVSNSSMFQQLNPITTWFLAHSGIFWAEIAAFVAFGLSWFVKGEELLKKATSLNLAA